MGFFEWAVLFMLGMIWFSTPPNTNAHNVEVSFSKCTFVLVVVSFVMSLFWGLIGLNDWVVWAIEFLKSDG